MINILAYADDVLVKVSSKEELWRVVNLVRNWCALNKMKLNDNKSYKCTRTANRYGGGNRPKTFLWSHVQILRSDTGQ